MHEIYLKIDAMVVLLIPFVILVGGTIYQYKEWKKKKGILIKGRTRRIKSFLTESIEKLTNIKLYK